MAIGVAFALASYLAQSALNSPQFSSGEEGASSIQLPAQNIATICCNPPYVGPKEAIHISANPLSSSLTLYVMRTNVSVFDSWISARATAQSSQPFYGYGSPANASLFFSYLTLHNSELISKYNISAGGSYQTNFFPQDVEPLMIVLLNTGNQNTTIQYSVVQNPIQIPPDLGYEAAAGLVLAGVLIFAPSYFLVSISRELRSR